MPRYFVDLEIDDVPVRDPVGADYQDAGAAQREALEAIDDLSRVRLKDGHPHSFAGSVRDHSGKLLFKARLSLMIDAV